LKCAITCANIFYNMLRVNLCLDLSASLKTHEANFFLFFAAAIWAYAPPPKSSERSIPNSVDVIAIAPKSLHLYLKPFPS
jgi:hypothetical protein